MFPCFARSPSRRNPNDNRKAKIRKPRGVTRSCVRAGARRSPQTGSTARKIGRSPIKAAADRRTHEPLPRCTQRRPPPGHSREARRCRNRSRTTPGATPTTVAKTPMRSACTPASYARWGAQFTPATRRALARVRAAALCGGGGLRFSAGGLGLSLDVVVERQPRVQEARGGARGDESLGTGDPRQVLAE